MPTFRGTSWPLSDLGGKKKTAQHKQVLKMMEIQTHMCVCEQEQPYMYIHEAHQGI